MTPTLLSIPMRHFLEVARSGSVNQAAARLFVAASAVSRQIAKLEDGLGTSLFERHPRGMTLTSRACSCRRTYATRCWTPSS